MSEACWKVSCQISETDTKTVAFRLLAGELQAIETIGTRYFDRFQIFTANLNGRIRDRNPVCWRKTGGSFQHKTGRTHRPEHQQEIPRLHHPQRRRWVDYEYCVGTKD